MRWVRDRLGLVGLVAADLDVAFARVAEEEGSPDFDGLLVAEALVLLPGRFVWLDWASMTDDLVVVVLGSCERIYMDNCGIDALLESLVVMVGY